MKHYIDLNCFGTSWFNPNLAAATSLPIFDFKERPWLCKIHGWSKNYKGYNREFIKSKPIQKIFGGYDLLLYTWKLEENYLYEYRNFMCDFEGTHFAHGYFSIKQINGKKLIECVDRSEVNDLLDRRLKNEHRQKNNGDN